jgi:hypothetical protein
MAGVFTLDNLLNARLIDANHPSMLIIPALFGERKTGEQESDKSGKLCEERPVRPQLSFAD